MKLPAAHLAQTWASEDLASRENEDGAATSPLSANRQPAAKPPWTPLSAMDQGRFDAPRGADKGITDTHTLAIMQISFLLLIPALGSVAVFWAAVAMSAPG